MPVASDSLSDTGRSVLVIGGTSFIAAHLLPRLVAKDYEVFATRRQGKQHAVAGVRWIEADLASEQAASSWPARIDSVMYLAQSRRWRSFPDGASDVFDINVAGVFRAAEYARVAGARRFIVASTGSVYGARPDPAKESDPVAMTAPRHFYIAAKMAAELLLQPYTALMHVVTLRLFVPYGPGQSPEMLIPNLVHRVRTGEPIQLDGAEGLRLNPVAVTDVVETVERVSCLDASLTLNVAGPEVLSLRQVAEQIGEALGRRPVFEVRGAAERALLGDTTAMRQSLSWVPSLRFNDALKMWLQAEP